MPLLSIIVPVYNTAPFLLACIESILSQDFTSFDLILIDDGSTDNSGIICDDFARKDSRIHVFHKKNEGVSSARNLGLDNAYGEWVYFVDSDDQILPEGLRTLVNGISEDVDIVLGGYERYDESGTLFYKINDQITTLLSKKESLITLYETHGLYYNFLSYGCIRLLRNRIIQDNQLRFNTSLKNKEDTLFLTEYICLSNGITHFTTHPVYRYNERADSAMGSWKHGFDYKYIDSLSALIEMKRIITRHFPLFSEVRYVSNEGIWIRYNKILDRMKELGVSDDDLSYRMRAQVFREIGPLFFVRKKVRKWRRRLRLNH